MQKRIKIYMLFFFLFYSCVAIGSSNSNYLDSLKQVLKESSGHKRIKALNDLADACKLINPVQAMIYGNLAFEQAKKKGNQLEAAKSLRIMGDLFFSVENHDKALEYWIKELAFTKKSGEPLRIADTYCHIAWFHRKLKNTGKAFEYYNEAINVLKEHNQRSAMGECYSKLGDMFLHDFNSPDEALKYFRESLRIFEEQQDIKELGEVLLTIGNIYHLKGKNDLAIEYVNEATRFINQQGDESDKAKGYFLLGNIYLASDEYENAYDSYLKSYSAYQKDGYIEKAAISLKKAGVAATLQKKFNEGLELLDSSYFIAKALDLPEQQMLLQKEISETYTKTGNPEKSALAYQKYLKLKEEYENQKKQKQIKEQKEANESTKINRELLSKEQEIKKQILQKQRSKRIYFLVISITIIIAFLLFFFISQKKSNTKPNTLTGS
jgi:tetratricopeptide (TPR) repeat protein